MVQQGAGAELWDTYQKTGTSSSSYQANLRRLGVADRETPTAIYIYPKSFDAKEAISEEIDQYNKSHKSGEISFTDYIGIMLSSVAIILDVITYVLVAFVSISLVVSSIMIGIITYISVLERIKEIGILRAVGASKTDISRVFLAETLIVGFAAGMIGIIFTLLLSIPVNFIIQTLSGFGNIGAKLPFVGAVALVAISMALTLFAGLIPAKIAAKKEPVEALRSE
jgi:putative ABC transport system permease protein